MIITITGDAGSGKSTIGKMLSEKLGYERFYMGQIRRDAAKKRGMTLSEYNAHGETHPETDLEVEEYQKKIAKEKKDFIIEGRTSWFIIPNSVKLYFKVDPLEGAKRIFNELQGENKRNEDNQVKTIKDIVESNKKRALSDKYRYQKYYQKNCVDEKNFDFIVDTTNLSQEEAFEETWKFVKEKING